MNKTFILTGKRLNGHIEVNYIDGVLNAVSASLKEPLNDKQFKAFANVIPRLEDDLKDLKLIGLHCIQEVAPNIKLNLFCRKYEQHYGIKYKVSPADAGKIKLIRFEEEDIDKYFTSDNFLFKGKHSISNLVKYYNEFRVEVATGAKSKYPDYFSKNFQDKLPDGELKFYWSHLRGLGLLPKQDRLGNTIDWIKKEERQ